MTMYRHCYILFSMKSKFLIIRISKDEKKQIKKAARNSKSVAAFLLSSARMAVKYRKLLTQAEALAGKYTRSELQLTVAGRR